MIFDYSTYSNLVFIGDIHHTVNNLYSVIEKSKDTLFITTGDFNIGVHNFEDYVELFEYLSYKLEANNNYLFIIRGNHDNPKYFKKNSTISEVLNERARNVILVPDYSIVKTVNYNILCIGGARSIDRVFNIKNIDWFQNENIQKPDDNFFNQNDNIDIIVSHSAPLFALPLEFSNELKFYNSFIVNSYALYDKTMKNDIYKERLLLKGIYEKLNNKHHIQYLIYGHYHKHIESQYNKTKCISLGLGEIKQLA